ncbi:thiamine diphosphokinase [Virgibacillus sp. W0430]|uniref:thiamine diphosphokinase n=1 Tax=Virgibacillus sp. W0430 TaxID=3391580 RepID=UPI003F48E269
MIRVGIVANGPNGLVPDIVTYKDKIDVWIGADGGAWTLIKNGIQVDYAIGDFDSITKKEKESIKKSVKTFALFPTEKDKTDLELAIDKAVELTSEKVYIFGATGGRLDHELINIQLLYSLAERNIKAVIVDKFNELELTFPGTHTVYNEGDFPTISFVPFSPTVEGLTLTGFYYPLNNKTISWGSTRCISNKLNAKSGTFYYEAGILLVIKSRDATF